MGSIRALIEGMKAMETKEVAVESIDNVTLENLFSTPEGQKVLSCIQCGACAGTCPYGEYMSYPPRRIIEMLRVGMIEKVFESNSLLNCVACYACMAKCPRGIRLTEVLLPLVKEEMFARLPEVPAELQSALQNMLRYGNPDGLSPRKRADWVKTVDLPIYILPDNPKPVDVLWFVECEPSYHPRGQDASRAVVKLFYAIKTDFGILGNEERCAGECARLVGEAGLFETLRERNMGVFRKYQFNRIVTNGAHAYDAFKYIYPDHGFNYPLDHTTTYFAKHLEELKPHLTKKLKYTVTYHDNCVLNRHNGFYDEPRALLTAIPGIKLMEMTHNRLNTQCCGGGGGGTWLDTYFKSKGMDRLSDRRIKEAVATGADVLAVSCPNEVSRFEDALKLIGYENKMIVRDVMELLAESLGE
jgi:Fe-S oxidoreductase